MSKQYSVRTWVKDTKADREAVRLIQLENKGIAMIDKDARDLLARRRFAASIKAAGRSPAAVDEKDIKVSLSITRPCGRSEGCISIELTDSTSRARFLELKIPLAQFSEALTGLMVTDIPAHVRGLDVVGKHKVIERRSKECPLDGFPRNEELEAWLEENAQEDGWILDPYLRSQGSISRDGEKTVLNYYVHKYVDEAPEE